MIRKVSKKRARQLREYKPLRDKYLSEHPVCECCKIHLATQCHHMAGKEGLRLLDVTRFFAVCHTCHERITRDSKWAIENGYSISRNKTQN